MCVCGIHVYLAILKRKQEATKNFTASNLTAFIDFFSSPEPKAHKVCLTAWPIKVKFYVEHPWVGGTKV